MMITLGMCGGEATSRRALRLYATGASQGGIDGNQCDVSIVTITRSQWLPLMSTHYDALLGRQLRAGADRADWLCLAGEERDL